MSNIDLEFLHERIMLNETMSAAAKQGVVRQINKHTRKIRYLRSLLKKAGEDVEVSFMDSILNK